MAKPRTYDTLPDRVIEPSAGALQERAEILRSKRRPVPELRIFRPVSVNASNRWQWQEALDGLEGVNRFKGRTSNFGGMVLTFVGDRDMKLMLREGMPHLLNDGNRPQLLRFMDKLARDYRGLVRDNSKRQQDVQDKLLEARVTNDEFFVPEDLKYEEEMDSHRLWNFADVPIKRNLDYFGNTKLGVVIADDAVIKTEIDETYRFLRANNLDTNLMTDSIPHVSIFTTVHTIGSVGLTPVGLPEYISLDPPQAFINRNS